MRIEQFDPRVDGDRLATCHEILEAGRPQDDPAAPPMSAGLFRNWWADGYAGDPRQVWLATDAHRPVGCYLLELPDRENTELGVCFPVVAPTSRRRGIGSALLTHSGEQAHTAGRTRLITETREGSPGESFARAAGAQGGLTEIRRVLEIDDELPARLTTLRALAESRTAGYELLSWSGLTPAEHLDQVTRLNEVMADAPHDAAIEAEQWDAARVRQAESTLAARGLRLYSVAARQSDSGELVALTQIFTDPVMPLWAFQKLTAVARSHRGHRLGLLIKVAMHQWLADLEPGARRVLTGNAETNVHMIAINEQLGFRATDRFRSWELSVADILARGARADSAPR